MFTPENNIQEYRFCRVSFGINSSPFLQAATLEHHLQKYNFNTAEKIRNDINVDNVITGSESVENAVKFYTEAKQLFTKAGMNLCDWATNDQETLDIIKSEDKSCAEKMKILGLTWIMRTHLCCETHKTIQFFHFNLLLETLLKYCSSFTINRKINTISVILYK